MLREMADLIRGRAFRGSGRHLAGPDELIACDDFVQRMALSWTNSLDAMPSSIHASADMTRIPRCMPCRCPGVVRDTDRHRRRPGVAEQAGSGTPPPLLQTRSGRAATAPTATSQNGEPAWLLLRCSGRGKYPNEDQSYGPPLPEE